MEGIGTAGSYPRKEHTFIITVDFGAKPAPIPEEAMDAMYQSLFDMSATVLDSYGCDDYTIVVS